jgi:hypothetical protein
MPIKEVLFTPTEQHLHGATLGQAHIKSFADKLVLDGRKDVALITDFSSALSVTASYLKATILWALKCGRAYAQGSITKEADVLAVRPHRLFTFVTGCSPDVASDIHEFFVGRNLTVIHLDRWNENQLTEGRILGTLDPVLFRTLESVIELRECTASQLSERSSETITVNGWSNRLADLHLLRLVTRRRESKFWIYSPIIERVSLWA